MNLRWPISNVLRMKTIRKLLFFGGGAYMVNNLKKVLIFWVFLNICNNPRYEKYQQKKSMKIPVGVYILSKINQNYSPFLKIVFPPAFFLPLWEYDEKHWSQSI